MTTLKRPRTTLLAFSRLVSVSACLCTFTFLPLPQLAALTGAESAEGECPCQEDGENSKEELVVSSSARRRMNDRRKNDFGRPKKTGYRLPPITSDSDRLPAIIGHQLADGLCAPLLI